jgi:hypothetical protein
MRHAQLTYGGFWIIAALGLADASLFAVTGMSLVWAPAFHIGMAALALGVLGWVYSGPRNVPRLGLLARLGLRLILFTAAAEMLNILLDSWLRLPLWDSRFAAADATLGFHWPALDGWVLAHPPVHAVFSVVYLLLGPEFIALILLLSLTGREAAAVRLWRLFAVTALATILLGVLLPATGPFAWFHPPGGLAVPYVAQYAALRDGALRTINLATAEGLISFPSFHACLALLCMQAARALPGPARWPFLALNLVIILASPSAGGHYLIDILGGLIVASLAMRALSPRKATETI